jgi:hypothetical protein
VRLDLKTISDLGRELESIAEGILIGRAEKGATEVLSFASARDGELAELIRHAPARPSLAGYPRPGGHVCEVYAGGTGIQLFPFPSETQSRSSSSLHPYSTVPFHVIPRVKRELDV